MRLTAVIGAGHLVRYHTTHTLRNPTLAEHIYGVICVLDYIWGNKPPINVIRHACYHDTGEYLTGDLPHPFKRSIDASFIAALEDAEQSFVDRLELDLFPVVLDERTTIKLADILEMGYFAAREIRMGNSYGWQVFHNVEKVSEDLIGQLHSEELQMRAIEVWLDIKVEANK